MILTFTSRSPQVAHFTYYRTVCSFWKDAIRPGSDCTIVPNCSSVPNHGVLNMTFESRNRMRVSGDFDDTGSNRVETYRPQPRGDARPYKAVWSFPDDVSARLNRPTTSSAGRFFALGQSTSRLLTRP